MHEQDCVEQQQSTDSPDPTRFAALAGEWRIEAHDDHPDNYVVSGCVAGEDFWESTGPENDAHIALRAEAIVRVPAMLRQLTEAYELLLDMSLRSGIAGGERLDETANPDRTGERLRALVGDISGTLGVLELHGRRLGFESFAIVDNSGTGGIEPVCEARFSEHGAAHSHARALSRREAAERGEAIEELEELEEFVEELGPEYLVVPARLVDAGSVKDHQEEEGA